VTSDIYAVFTSSDIMHSVSRARNLLCLRNWISREAVIVKIQHFGLWAAFDLSKKAVGRGVERRRLENRGAECAEGKDVNFDYFYFKIVNSDTLCILILKFYLQSKAEKATSSHGVIGDWQWYRHENSFINLVNLSLSSQ